MACMKVIGQQSSVSNFSCEISALLSQERQHKPVFVKPGETFADKATCEQNVALDYRCIVVFVLRWAVLSADR